MVTWERTVRVAALGPHTWKQDDTLDKNKVDRPIGTDTQTDPRTSLQREDDLCLLSPSISSLFLLFCQAWLGDPEYDSHRGV